MSRHEAQHVLQTCVKPVLYVLLVNDGNRITITSLPPRAGLQRLSTLQRLEVLHVPCDDAHAITDLATRLPRLRSLDLRCCLEEGVQASTQDLVLTAATRLTHLRLHLSTAHPKFMQRLRMPPHLQVLPRGQ